MPSERDSGTMTSDDWQPTVGDMVQVKLQKIPSVGMIIDLQGEEIIVKGAWWQEAFRKEEVIYIHPESGKGEEEC